MDQLDEIRSKLDIVELISQHITLKKAGRNFKALCPFHGEKTPSFIISPERQIFKCFGCQVGGDVFKFYMEMEGVGFGEAVKELAKRAGVTLKDFRPSKDQEKKQRLLQINHLSSEYFHYILTNHQVGQKAFEYLEKRGVGKNSIKEFVLGYAPDSWEGLLSWLVRKKGYQYQELEEAGLAIKGRGWYARFRGRVIFPLTDLQGNILGFAGRVMVKNADKAKYINSPETLLYHKSSHLYGLYQTKGFIRKKNKAILVEGELDAISSYQANVKNVAAIKGSALTEEHIRLLKRFCETLIFALDSDKAGDAAMRRGLELVEAAGMNLKIVELPAGKDPDELARKSPKQWRKAVKEAVSMYDFVINSAVKRFGIKSPEAKRKVSQEAVLWLSRIQNEVVKSHFVKKLAKILDVSEEAIILEVVKQSRRQKNVQIQTKPLQTDRPAESRQDSLEEYLLALVVQADFWKELVKKINISGLQKGAAGKILNKLKKSKKLVSMIQFAKSLPEELQAVFDSAYLKELPELSYDKWVEEVGRTTNELGRLNLRDKLKNLREELKTKDKNKRKKIVAEISETLKHLQVLNNG